MTNLNFPVRRRTRDAYPVLRHKPEKIVVTLSPGDVLVFRKERGRREWYLCPVQLLPGGHTFKVGLRAGANRRWHELKILFHGGDNGEPCATVMLPDED